MLSRREVLEYLAATITDELTIGSVGVHSREWAGVMPADKRDTHLFRAYMAGTTPIALGLARALPNRKVVALDGDGSILMSLSILPCIAHKNPSNLIVLIFDNESYEFGRSGIKKQVPSFTADVADLAKMAQASGIKNAKTVTDLEGLRKAYQEALHANGPSFIVMKTEISVEPLPWVAMDGIESKYRVARHVEKSENRVVINVPAWKDRFKKRQPG